MQSPRQFGGKWKTKCLNTLQSVCATIYGIQREAEKKKCIKCCYIHNKLIWYEFYLFFVLSSVNSVIKIILAPLLVFFEKDRKMETCLWRCILVDTFFLVLTLIYYTNEEPKPWFRYTLEEIIYIYLNLYFHFVLVPRQSPALSSTI